MTRWLAAAIVLGAIGATAYIAYMRGQQSVEAMERARAAEAELLEADDLLVAAQVRREVLESDTKRLAGENLSLVGALARARRIAPTARARATLEASTGPVVVAGTAPCLLAPGDELDLRIGAVTLRTEAGNDVFVAGVEAWRVLPPPDTLLAMGELRGQYLREEPEPSPERGLSLPWWASIVAGLVGFAGGVVIAK